MEDFPVFDQITISSHKGVYGVSFMPGAIEALNNNPIENAVYIVDGNIARLYEKRLPNILNSGRTLIIEAVETNKSLDKIPHYVESLVKLGAKRKQPLCAIGGGIIQDIACFLASVFMRGLPWVFYPTTLLAQADSCIGSKSSINCGDIKNILGTYNPPKRISIDTDFLETLESQCIQSGVGEMLKVHAIDSPDSFDRIAGDYDKIFNHRSVMQKYIHDSLLIKKKLIEIDEFDEGPRNVMNYGHSFGHAIESATNYFIPHGVAVTIGMDLANYVAVELGSTTAGNFQRMHGVMKKNYSTFYRTKIDTFLLLAALAKDKKNTSMQLRLILPDMAGNITSGLYNNDKTLTTAVVKYFDMFWS